MSLKDWPLVNLVFLGSRYTVLGKGYYFPTALHSCKCKYLHGNLGRDEAAAEVSHLLTFLLLVNLVICDPFSHPKIIATHRLSYITAKGFIIYNVLTPSETPKYHYDNGGQN